MPLTILNFPLFYVALCMWNSRKVKVLIPGAGLGRLALEVAGKGMSLANAGGSSGGEETHAYLLLRMPLFTTGFASQGNEFSAHMLIASNWVLNSYVRCALTFHSSAARR